MNARKKEKEQAFFFFSFSKINKQKKSPQAEESDSLSTMNPSCLQTERLRLRVLLETDAERLSEYRSDAEVAKYQGWEAPYTLESALKLIRGLHPVEPLRPADGQWLQLGIELQGDGRLIGDCAFQILADDPQQAEIGVTLERSFQGRGYASEALRRLLQHLFEGLGLHRVRANADPENAPCLALLKTLGMRKEGHLIKSLWWKERWADEVWFAILKEEWKT